MLEKYAEHLIPAKTVIAAFNAWLASGVRRPLIQSSATEDFRIRDICSLLRKVRINYFLFLPLIFFVFSKTFRFDTVYPSAMKVHFYTRPVRHRKQIVLLPDQPIRELPIHLPVRRCLDSLFPTASFEETMMSQVDVPITLTRVFHLLWHQRLRHGRQKYRQQLPFL